MKAAAGPRVVAVTQYKIKTTATGLYKVTYAALTGAGFNPTGIDTDTFQLFHEGQEVAFFMFDGGDHRFDPGNPGNPNDPGDYFLFYANAKLTRFTDYDIYWFQAGANQRLVPGSRNGAPGSAPLATSFRRSLHFEQNLTYQPGLPLTGEADRWYWRFFKACLPGDRTCRDAVGNKNSRSFTLDLPAVSLTAHTAELTTVVRGQSSEYANPDHHMQVFVNGTQVGDSLFDGAILFSGVYNVASSLLLSGANTVRLDFPADLPGATNQSNSGYLNFFDVTYNSDFIAQNNSLAFSGDDPGLRKFQITNFTDPNVLVSNVVVIDVTDPRHPVWINGVDVSGAGPYTAAFESDNGALSAQAAKALPALYYAAAPSALQQLSSTSISADAPSSLKSTGNGADYIVITHATFLAQAQQLAAYRANGNGYRTAVVDVQDIYDEFNNGLMDQEAIRTFISYASHYWQPPRPRYVVLMGDGHYDFLNLLGSNETIFIPPYVAAVDPFHGDTAADNRYVDILGDEQYDSDGDAANTARDVVISNGHMNLAVDFGFHPIVLAQSGAVETQRNSDAGTQRQEDAETQSPASPTLVKAIGDMVFWDDDLDGVWDANERGVPGVTVNLWAGGVVFQSQVTDANGNYFFEDIPSDTYTLQFVPPAGWQFTTRNAQGADCNASHGDVVICDRYDSDVDPATGFTEAITYTYPQQAQDNWDAGLVRPGTIGNLVWLDSNANGLQDSGEAGIPGVLIELLQSNVAIATTTTDANGYYFFPNLANGVYAVRVAASNFAGVLSGRTLSPQDQGLDLMPDLSLGRFPVGTVAEAQEMVNRVMQYEMNQPVGDWPKRVLFVTDNPDGAGDFYDHSNSVADHIWPYAAESQKIYYKQTHPDTTSVTNAVINGINQGALFVTFNGHSGTNQWGSSEHLFNNSDVDLLNNTIFPVFLPMTCLEGQFLNPNFTSMGEKAVRTIGKGAIASFSPTGYGVATGHTFLYTAFFEGAVSGETQLGPLTVMAKDKLFESHSQFKDLLDAYVLFGDPALRIKSPQPDVTITKAVQPAGSVSPGDTITYTLTYTNVGTLTATNVVITDLLPSSLQNPSVSSNPALTPNPGTTYIWPVGDLTPNQGGAITIVARVDPNQPPNTQIDNTAIIGATQDGNPDNNRSSTSTPVAASITLSGMTWYDLNGNGIRNTAETMPVTFVSISATRVSTGVSYPTQTNNAGHWSLTGLPPGTYQITAALPPFLVATTPLTRNITVLAGGSAIDQDFGYISPTAVQLTHFAAQLQPEGVVIQWQTAGAESEQGLDGFYVRRSATPNDYGKRISSLIPSSGSGEGSQYSFVDRTVSEGGWHYWLEAVERAGENSYAQFFGPVYVPPQEPAGQQKIFLGLVLR